MSRVEIKAEAILRLPSGDRFMNEIIASLDRYGFAIINDFFLEEIEVKYEGGFMGWLLDASRRYGWEIIREVDRSGFKIVRKGEVI